MKVEKPLLGGFVSMKENLLQGEKPFCIDRVHIVCVGSFRLLQTKHKTFESGDKYVH